MASTETHSMPRNQFLTIAVNLLHRAFVETPRTEAKNLFRGLAEGRRAALTRVEMEDKSTVRFDLSLDHSAYKGSLNYGAFRASLRALLGNLVAALQEDRDIATFGAENNPDRMIFGITGVTEEDGVPAVMVLAADIGSGDAVQLQLMYLDYTQFRRSQAPQPAPAGDAPA